MGKFSVTISDAVENEFRAAVAKERGLKKGQLTPALEDAMKMYVEYVEKKHSEKSKKK